MNSEFFKIFKAGSVTYFYCSLFFPPEVRDDVFRLYAFVRTADDFVDCIPPKKKEFLGFKNEYFKVLSLGKSNNKVIDSMVELIDRRNFKQEWVESFLEVMEQDLNQTKCQTLDDTIDYMYGSAEVIGLMMAKIMNLPDKATESAQMLGRAFQYVNFIRDIAEDNSLGRQYIPVDVVAKYGLESLCIEDAQANQDKFTLLIRDQINLYRQWMLQASKGFEYIPKRFRVPIQTSAQMYDWTAEQIAENPLVVFGKKVKPSPTQVVKQIALNWWGEKT